jgi:membrane-associated phospholipid phosphatase
MMSTEDTSANVIHGTARPHSASRLEAIDARSISLGLLGVYLVATALVLARASGNGGLVVTHGMLVLVVAWALRARSDAAKIVGDFLPLCAAPALYAEIPALIAAAQTVYHDAAIQSIELAVFGAQAARVFAAAAPNLALSELLHAGYLAYYPAIFVPPLLLYLRGNRRGYLETVAALVTTYLVCWLIFVIAPVEGPRYQWGPAADAPRGPMQQLANAVLARGSSRGAAFPSSHMAVMAAQALMALRWQRRSGVIISVVAVLVGLGAVYGGFHYATDIVAGAALGTVIAALLLYLFSKRAQ